MKITKFLASLLLSIATSYAASDIAVGFGKNTTISSNGTTFHVNTYKDLILAVNNNDKTKSRSSEPKIIYIDSPIDGFETDDGGLLTEKDFARDFSMEQYEACFSNNGEEWRNTTYCNRIETYRLDSVEKLSYQIVVEISSNTTIIGSGSKSKIRNVSFQISNAKNVVFKDLYIETPRDLFPSWNAEKGEWKSAEYDSLYIQNSNNIWIDNCYFTDGEKTENDLGMVFNKPVEVYHNIIFISGGDKITISNSRFEDHQKTILIERRTSNNRRYNNPLPPRNSTTTETGGSHKSTPTDDKFITTAIDDDGFHNSTTTVDDDFHNSNTTAIDDDDFHNSNTTTIVDDDFHNSNTTVIDDDGYHNSNTTSTDDDGYHNSNTTSTDDDDIHNSTTITDENIHSSTTTTDENIPSSTSRPEPPESDKGPGKPGGKGTMPSRRSNELRITLHNNVFYNCGESISHIRTGKIHIFNNLYYFKPNENSYDFKHFIGLESNCNVLSEYNLFNYNGDDVDETGIVKILANDTIFHDSQSEFNNKKLNLDQVLLDTLSKNDFHNYTTDTFNPNEYYKYDLMGVNKVSDLVDQVPSWINDINPDGTKKSVKNNDLNSDSSDSAVDSLVKNSIRNLLIIITSMIALINLI